MMKEERDKTIFNVCVRAIRHLGTSAEALAPTHPAAQRAKLDAYEALLLLALQAGSTPAVAHLARGALALLEAHPRVLPDEARAAARGRFWSNVFLCALDQGDFEVRKETVWRAGDVLACTLARGETFPKRDSHDASSGGVWGTCSAAPGFAAGGLPASIGAQPCQCGRRPHAVHAAVCWDAPGLTCTNQHIISVLLFGVLVRSSLISLHGGVQEMTPTLPTDFRG